MNDKEIDSHIKSISIKNWNSFFDLIPQIQSISKVGEWHGGKPDSNGIIEFPYVVENRELWRLVTVMYELDLVIDFNCGKWNKGNEIFLSNSLQNRIVLLS